jgi:hypothetical protein
MGIDQNRARLVKADEFDMGAMAAQAGDHFVERAHGGHVPQMRRRKVDPHRSCRLAQVEAVGKDPALAKKTCPATV